MEIDNTSFEQFLKDLSKTQDQLSLIKHYNYLRENQRYYVNERGEKIKRKMGPAESLSIIMRLNDKTKSELAVIFSNNDLVFTPNFKKCLEEAYLINTKAQDYYHITKVDKNHALKLIEFWTPKNSANRKEILTHVFNHNPYLKEDYKEEIFQMVVKNQHLTHILDTVELLLEDSIVNYLRVTETAHLIRKNNVAYLISKGFEINEKTMMKYIKANATSQIKIMVGFCDMTENLFNMIKTYTEKYPTQKEAKDILIEAEQRYLDKNIAHEEKSTLVKKIKI